MSQFKFLTDMNNLQNLDGELKTQSKPRWQRKMETNSMNGSINASKLSISYNNSYAAMANTTITGSKTPNKSMAEAGCSRKKTPSDKKSPGKFAQQKIEQRNFHSFLFSLKDARRQQTVRKHHRERQEVIASSPIEER